MILKQLNIHLRGKIKELIFFYSNKNYPELFIQKQNVLCNSGVAWYFC